MRRSYPRAYTTDYPQMWRAASIVLVLAGLASIVELVVGWHGAGRYSGLQGIVASFSLAATAWWLGPKLPPRWSPWIGRAFLLAAIASVTASEYTWRNTHLAGGAAFNYVIVALFAALYLGPRDVAIVTGTIGIAYWFASRGETPGMHLFGWFAALEVVAATGIAVLLLARKMEELSFHDSLTGALNRRAWDRAVAYELSEHTRRGETLSVALVDIDNLKTVNDRDGHDAGDALLRRAAEAWSTSLRSSDVIARLGGDEFGILFTRTPASAAERLAERLVEVLARTGASCTVGVAVAFPGDSASGVIAAADRLLYAGKGDGRGRAMFSRDLDAA